jgi:dipeptidase E
MKFYLSPHKIGNGLKELKSLIPKKNKSLAFIPNALDYTCDLMRRQKSEQGDIDELEVAGFKVERIDLRHYFGKESELEEKLKSFGTIWVRGGNVFVLRRAMKLSGLDLILKKMIEEKKDILYGGYGAGVVILGPTLRGYEIIDDINQRPYLAYQATIWGGLGLIDYCIAIHYDPKVPKANEMGDVVEYYEKNKILYKPLKDGDVIIEK